MATVVKILDPDKEKGLKTGDIKRVKLTGANLVGFRVVPEGEIIS